jgi:tRNA A-37 threonylcarbamoyl transferase component Bud32
MGEVYRARDTRLDRDVAVKVLPANLSSDPNLCQRLEREAKAVPKLSHPNICTLHDIGHHDGVDFLVMELVEGETLEHKLTKGPLPPEQVVRCAAEIADALTKAHKLGITHRDLKPSNVMLTKSGAKRFAQENASSRISSVESENANLRAGESAKSSQLADLDRQLKEKQSATVEEIAALAEKQSELEKLSNQLSERQRDIDRERQLLAASAQARALITARNLHINDVHDNDRSGQQVPFGASLSRKASFAAELRSALR